MSVPPHVLAASLAALALNDAQLPVAHLVRDSLVDGEAPCTLPGARSLCFENDQVSVHINVVIVDAEHRQVSLAVTPAEFVRATLLQPRDGVRLDLPPLTVAPVVPAGEQDDVEQDDVEQDAAEQEATGGPVDVAPGLTALVLQDPEGRSVRTAWVVV